MWPLCSRKLNCASLYVLQSTYIENQDGKGTRELVHRIARKIITYN